LRIGRITRVHTSSDIAAAPMRAQTIIFQMADE